MSKNEVTKYQKFEIVRLHRSQIKLALYNPRKMSPSAARRLKKTLSDSKIGLVETVVWNKRTGNLVGGHQRVTQLDALEGDDYYLDVSAIDVDDAIEKTINIALNNPSMQGTYDLPALEEVIAEIHDAGIDLEKTGYAASELQMVLSTDFVTELFKDQVQDEAPDIAVMQEMFDSTADIRAQEREAAKQRKKLREQALEDEGESSQGDDIEGEDHEEYEGEDEDLDSDLSPEEVEAEKIRRMKEIKKAHREAARADQESADVVFTLVFENDSKLREFLSMIQYERPDRVAPATEVLEALGVQF